MVFTATLKAHNVRAAIDAHLESGLVPREGKAAYIAITAAHNRRPRINSVGTAV